MAVSLSPGSSPGRFWPFPSLWLRSRYLSIFARGERKSSPRHPHSKKHESHDAMTPCDARRPFCNLLGRSYLILKLPPLESATALPDASSAVTFQLSGLPEDI